MYGMDDLGLDDGVLVLERRRSADVAVSDGDGGGRDSSSLKSV